MTSVISDPPPDYNVKYDNTLSQIDNLAVKSITAYKNSNTEPTNLTVGASSNVVIEAIDGINVIFNSNDSLKLYNYSFSNNVRTDNEIFKIQKMAGYTSIYTSNSEMRLAGGDVYSTTTISKTTLSDSNTKQVFETTGAFQFENPVYLMSNLIVNDSIVGYNNLAVSGNCFSSTMNIYKSVSPTIQNNNKTQVAYAFYINQYDQLQIVKYDKYGTSNVTSTIQSMGTFGPMVAGNYTDAASNYQVLNQFNGLVSSSNGQTSTMLWFLGADSQDIYYDQGYVGIGTSTPATPLHIVGTTTVTGDIVPSTPFFTLGTSNSRFASIFGNSLDIQGDINFTGTIYQNGIQLSTGGDISGVLRSASNLSDLTNKLFARSNLGLGSTNDVTFASLTAGTVVASAFSNLVNNTSSTSTTLPPTANAVKTAYDIGFYSSNTASNAMLKSANLSDLTNASSARSNIGLGDSNNVVFSNITFSGDLMPTQNHVQNIGSSNLRFNSAWIDTIHIATNTLYLGDTPVLGTSNNTVGIRADPNQGINISTTGTGYTQLTSEKGIDIQTSGNTHINKTINIQSIETGGNVNVSASNQITFTAPLSVFNGNSTMNGSLITTGLTVNGDIVVTGSNFTANVVTVEVQDNIMLLNKGEVGNGVTRGSAGIRIDRGEGVDYQMVFTESEQMFQMGAIGSLETIASRPWVGTNYLFKTSNLADLGNVSTARNNLGLGTANDVTFGSVSATTVVATSFSNLVDATNSTSTVLPPTANAVKTAYDLGVYGSNSAVFGSNAAVFGSNAAVFGSNLAVSASNRAYAWISSGAYMYTASNIGIALSVAPSSNYALQVGGNIWAQSDIIAYSDRRIKTDIVNIPNPLEKVAQLNGCTFNMIGDKKRHTGLIAQDVLNVLPEAVYKDETTEDGLYSLAYGNISGLLVEAIKDIKVRLEKLEAA